MSIEPERTVPVGNEPAMKDEEKTSWLPMVGLFLAQVLMSFNVAALPISLGGMVDDFGVPPTVAGSTIVLYGLAVAALVMTGAKLGQRIGWVLIFRIVVVLFAGSSLLMIFSRTVAWAIAGQALAGAAAAIIVPALVALIAENYRGAQQATAIGALGSARAISGVSAFLIGGTLGTLVGWRPVFVVVLAIAVAVFFLSFTLRADGADRSVQIDVVASILIGLAVVSLTVGFNNLNAWGVFHASEAAPFTLVGLSPALGLIVAGLIVGQIFFLWTRRRMRAGKVPLIDLSVIDSSKERAAIYAMFVIVMMEAFLIFTVPLYIQIVQGRTPFATSMAMMPFNLTVFVTATLVVRFYKKYPPRTIALFSFGLTTIALFWLSFVVTNNWETLPTILGLFVFGVGQGALVTLVFNVLVTSSPAKLAGDVGSLRGTTQNLASAVGTAVAGVLLVLLLSISVGRSAVEHPEIPEELIAEVDLDYSNFVSNDDLRATLEEVDNATTAQIEAALDVNEESRLLALKRGLLLLAGVSALAIIPASRLPRYDDEEIPDPAPTK